MESRDVRGGKTTRKIMHDNAFSRTSATHRAHRVCHTGAARSDGALAAITASRQIALSERRLARKMGKQQLLSLAAAWR